MPVPVPTLRQQAHTLAQALPALLVEAERVASTIALGVHGRRKVGAGETFWQYRRFREGDAASTIDWRQSARSQNHFIRETEYEAAETVWLWCDQSASMNYKSKSAPCTKQHRAIVLTLALTSLLVRGGERVAALGIDLPATGRQGLNRLAHHLLSHEPGPPHTGSLPPPDTLPRHAVIVLISDFLAPTQDIAAALERYTHDGVQGHLMQILDPSEVDLPFEGRTEFLGLENEGPLLVRRAQSLRDTYRQRMQAHQEKLMLTSRRYGWSFGTHQTSLPPQSSLLGLYAMLAGRGSNSTNTPRRDQLA